MKLNIIDKTPVADIVVHYPQTRQLLEDHNIDYCCGGKHSLKETCDKAQVSWQDMRKKLNDVIEESAAAPPPKDWITTPLSKLIRHILDAHHVYLRENLPRLLGLAEKAYQAHHQQHGEMLRVLEYSLNTLKTEIEVHLLKEEQVLFPLIQEMEAFEQGRGSQPTVQCGTIENPIRQMSTEHDSAGEILEQMRHITGGYELPDDACETFKALYDGLRELEKDLHDHIHLENNILFPKAIELENKICTPH